MSRRQSRNRSENFEILYEDEVTKEWLYTVSVEMNNCKAWYDDVMNPETTDKIYHLPVAAVLQDSSSVPERVRDAPELKYPQYNRHICF